MGDEGCMVFRDMLPRDDTVLKYHEGAVHNLPDENAHRAALEIKAMVERLTKDDILLVLISGKGSCSGKPCPNGPLFQAVAQHSFHAQSPK